MCDKNSSLELLAFYCSSGQEFRTGSRATCLATSLCTFAHWWILTFFGTKNIIQKGRKSPFLGFLQ